MATYVEETRGLFLMLVEAIVESLGLERDDEDILKQVEDGSQLLVLNCYPPCPEPDLTLGMPPHSDYGLLTLLLQDQVEGLQINHQDKWVTVQPVANSFVINVGDHLEDKNLSSGIFFLDLLSAVEPRVVNWNLVTKGETDDQKRLNATYIMSVARKLGFSIFLLPEDIMEVNQKMVLTLTASIMYWSLQQPVEKRGSSSPTNTLFSSDTDGSSTSSLNGENESSSLGGAISNLSIDDTASDCTVSSG